jgi:hypothetical protein
LGCGVSSVVAPHQNWAALTYDIVRWATHGVRPSHLGLRIDIKLNIKRKNECKQNCQSNFIAFIYLRIFLIIPLNNILSLFLFQLRIISSHHEAETEQDEGQHGQKRC